MVRRALAIFAPLAVVLAGSACGGSDRDRRGLNARGHSVGRHFFRHAYAVSFDAAQLRALRHDALSLRAPLVEDFERLDLFLQAVALATP